MTPFTVVIPARYGSTRFPGKVLAELGGRPIVEHVWRRARASGAAEVIVATDDERVAAAARAFGADVEMTDPRHASGTDRIAEVARRRRWDAARLVVNVQGDEPLVPPENIRQVAENLAARPEAAIATLVVPFTDRETLFDPNTAKVVCDAQGYALYFTRAAVPFDRDGEWDWADAALYRRHIGVYAYRVGDLLRFAGRPPAPLERVEKLEQLRALYYGDRIHVALAPAAPPPGVDTPGDLARLRAAFAGESC
ncbi:MAG: 3-deoxy-manno-octulosonate cytidylyltransferase [Gammaproteobacteria bacterium]|nr:MAG: 3-deoxy-manno-octulosonate cytidylyltransferase [Gammaproteobacteria bacterium]